MSSLHNNYSKWNDYDFKKAEEEIDLQDMREEQYEREWMEKLAARAKSFDTTKKELDMIHKLKCNLEQNIIKKELQKLLLLEKKSDKGIDDEAILSQYQNTVRRFKKESLSKFEQRKSQVHRLEAISKVLSLREKGERLLHLHDSGPLPIVVGRDQAHVNNDQNSSESLKIFQRGFQLLNQIKDTSSEFHQLNNVDSSLRNSMRLCNELDVLKSISTKPPSCKPGEESSLKISCGLINHVSFHHSDNIHQTSKEAAEKKVKNTEKIITMNTIVFPIPCFTLEMLLECIRYDLLLGIGLSHYNLQNWEDCIITLKPICEDKFYDAFEHEIYLDTTNLQGNVDENTYKTLSRIHLEAHEKLSQAFKHLNSSLLQKRYSQNVLDSLSLYQKGDKQNSMKSSRMNSSNSSLLYEINQIRHFHKKKSLPKILEILEKRISQWEKNIVIEEEEAQKQREREESINSKASAQHEHEEKETISPWLVMNHHQNLHHDHNCAIRSYNHDISIPSIQSNYKRAVVFFQEGFYRTSHDLFQQTLDQLHDEKRSEPQSSQMILILQISSYLGCAVCLFHLNEEKENVPYDRAVNKFWEKAMKLIQRNRQSNTSTIGVESSVDTQKKEKDSTYTCFCESDWNILLNRLNEIISFVMSRITDAKKVSRE